MIAQAFAMSGPGGGGAGGMDFMFLFVILGILYFMILRPQVKKQKQQKSMIGALKKGDKIITAGGIFGTIAGIKEKENSIILKISDNVKMEILKSSVAQVVHKEKEKEKEKENGGKANS